MIFHRRLFGRAKAQHPLQAPAVASQPFATPGPGRRDGVWVVYWFRERGGVRGGFRVTFRDAYDSGIRDTTSRDVRDERLRLALSRRGFEGKQEIRNRRRRVV